MPAASAAQHCVPSAWLAPVWEAIHRKGYFEGRLLETVGCGLENVGTWKWKGGLD